MMENNSGFFDSVDDDRIYTAEDFDHILDPIITNGVLKNYKYGLKVVLPTFVEEGKLQVSIMPGKAWFFDKWFTIDQEEVIDLEPSPTYNQRWDVIVIDCDLREDVRMYSLKYIVGKADKYYIKEGMKYMYLPDIIREEEHYQFPLAYIHVGRNVTALKENDIINRLKDRDIYSINTKEECFDPLNHINIDDDYVIFKEGNEEYRLQTIKDNGSNDVVYGTPYLHEKFHNNSITGNFMSQYNYLHFETEELTTHQMICLAMGYDKDELTIVDTDDLDIITSPVDGTYYLLTENKFDTELGSYIYTKGLYEFSTVSGSIVWSKINVPRNKLYLSIEEVNE